MTSTSYPTWKDPYISEPQARVRLRSLRALHETMEFEGFSSGYQLAKAARLKPGTVNHLVHGHRRTCSAATAHAISEALHEPQRRLFALDMSAIYVDSGQQAAA